MRPRRSRGPQAPGQARGPDRVEMKKVRETRRAPRPIPTGWPPGARATGRATSAGSARKMDAEAARQKARERKAEALGAPTCVDADPLPLE